jgi:dolichol-phosphate mannosyltransferase
LSRGFYALFNRISAVPIEPGAPDFFLLSRRARAALARMGDQRRFLRAMVTWIGFSRARVAYVPPPRVAGRSKYTFARMLQLAADALFAFSWAPLRLISLAGGFGVVLGAGLLVHGWLSAALGSFASFAGLLCLLAGVQLLALGVVGSYVLRIFEHSQGRPLYVLSEAPEPALAESRVREVAREQASARPRRASSGST